MLQSMDKACGKCREVRDIDEFGLDKSKKDGHRTVCKICSNTYNYSYYQRNKEKINKQAAKYRMAHAEKNKIWQRNYRDKIKNDPERLEKKNANARRYVKESKMKDPIRKRAILWMASVRARNKEMGCKTDLTFEILHDMGKNIIHCPICQTWLDFSYGKRKKPNAPSLDRLDSSIGYTQSNSNIICFRCNTMKNDGSTEDHQRIADWMRGVQK